MPILFDPNLFITERVVASNPGSLNSKSNSSITIILGSIGYSNGVTLSLNCKILSNYEGVVINISKVFQFTPLHTLS